MVGKTAALKEGDKAPDFTLPADGGGKITLSKFKGKPVVLYFYPKDDTSGCTAEACSFRDHLPKFGKIEAEVIGISRDSVASHDKFKQKYNLNFLLGSDECGEQLMLSGELAGGAVSQESRDWNPDERVERVPD